MEDVSAPSTRRRALLSKWDALTALAVFLLSLGVYVVNLAPQVGHGHDTAEMTCAALGLGIPHPPGYPLYVRMAHVWDQVIPFGTHPWRLNLFSAVGLSAGAFFLCLGLIRITSERIAAATATLLYCFALSVWRQAENAEVFGLHIFFMGFLLWLATLWSDADNPGRRKIVMLTGFVMGLCLAHHHTTALALPGLIVYGFLSKGDRKWGISIWLFLLLLTAAVPPYLDMMVRSQNHPTLNWGEPNTPERLWAHFLRKAYGTTRLSSIDGLHNSGQAHVLAYTVSVTRNQFPFPLILLPLFGIAAVTRPKWRAPWALFCLWAVCFGPVFAMIGSQPAQEFFLDMQERFYASSYLGLAGLASFSLTWILERLRERRLGVLGPLLLLLPILSLGLNWSRASEAGQYHAYDTVKAMISTVAQDGIFIVDGDLTCGVADYIQRYEGYRPDVLLVYPGLIGSGWFDSLLPTNFVRVAQRAVVDHVDPLEEVMREANRRGRAVYCNFRPRVAGTFRRRGLLWRWWPSEDTPPSEKEELQEQIKSLEELDKAPRRGNFYLGPGANFWMKYFRDDWVDAYKLAEKELHQARPDLAAHAIEQRIQMKDAIAVDYVNIGLLKCYVGRYPEAEVAYKKALELEPGNRLAKAALGDLYLSTGRPQEAEKIRQELGLRGRRTSPSPSPSASGQPVTSTPAPTR